MMLGQVDTSVSSVTVDDQGVVDWEYLKGAQVTLEAAEEEVRLISQLTNEVLTEACYLLIDIRPIRSIDGAARRLFASEETSKNYKVGVGGLALIIGSPVSRIIGNIWFSLNTPPHPTRLFTSKEEGRAWLLDACMPEQKGPAGQ